MTTTKWEQKLKVCYDWRSVCDYATTKKLHYVPC